MRKDGPDLPEKFGEHSLEFTRACEDLNRKHDAPYRSETHGKAEGAVRRVKEGTASVLVQVGLSGGWWRDATECSCQLRGTHDSFGVGDTADQKTIRCSIQRLWYTCWNTKMA